MLSGWESYRGVYGAELRAAAREFDDHGWPVVVGSECSLLLATGNVLDILEVPAALGRRICTHLRDTGSVVPVAATPTGTWWFPVASGAALPAELADLDGVTLHTAGTAMLAPPSQVPDGWVHWRVAPALTGYQLPHADLIIAAAVDSVRQHADSVARPGTQRPAAVLTIG